jgi:hypothetical protein
MSVGDSSMDRLAAKYAATPRKTREERAKALLARVSGGGSEPTHGAPEIVNKGASPPAAAARARSGGAGGQRGAPSVIDAVKRLERLGSDDSKSTAKLLDAALAVHTLVERVLGACGVEMGSVLPAPGGDGVGYCYTRLFVGWSVRLFLDVPGEGYSLPYSSRRYALVFAAHVASGWLDDLATWLEEYVQTSGDATMQLDKIAGRLRRAYEG